MAVYNAHKCNLKSSVQNIKVKAMLHYKQHR